MLGSWSPPRAVHQRRTFDGWAYQVSIFPWSDAFADKVRELCAGYDVRVVEDGHGGGTAPEDFGSDPDE